MGRQSKLIFPNQPRKQHIVPVDYLEWFESGEGKLWVYSENRLVRPSTAKNEAAQRDYFEVKVAGYETNYLFEKQLQRLEDSAKPALDRLRRCEQLKSGDLEWLSHYVVNLFLRSRQVRDRLSQPNDEDLLSEESLRSDQLGFFRATGKIAPLEQVRIAVEQAASVFNDLPLRHVEVLRRNSPPLVAVLQKRCWQIVEPDSGGNFVTSDAPVVSFQSRDGLVYAGYGWARENAHVALPLSPKRLLLISPFGWTWDRQLDRVSTETMNKLIISFAHRNVFASRNAENIQTLVDEKISSTKFGTNAYILPGKFPFADASTTPS